MSNHPLRPLDSTEVQCAVSLLKTLPHFTPKTRIVSIMLKEPPKEVVLKWSESEAAVANPLFGANPSKQKLLPDREAVAVMHDNGTNRASTVIMNLTGRKVVDFVQEPEGVQAAFTVDEEIEVENMLKDNPQFKEVLLRQYGIRDTSLVMADIWSVGYYGSEEEKHRRLARPLCFLRSDPTDNGYARPLEGIRPVVDVNSMEVIRIEEYGKWPLPPNAGNYAYDHLPDRLYRADIKPLLITQPDGPSFTLDGNHIKWQKWDFVIGFNAREALTIHHLRYEDKGKKRPVFYRASLCETVVPYADPRPTQRRKNAFDVGEYGMGMCANSLRLGCDCLGHIRYLDADLCNSRGLPLKIANAICIHEEDHGVLWKHVDRRMPEKAEVRRSRRLVVSCICTVENYEYAFYWYFYQDGNIDYEVKLTGILSVGAAQEGERPPWGTMVAPLVYAPNHQHFFSMRIDFCIDGTNNTVHQLDVKADDDEDDEQNPYKNGFRCISTPLQSERQAIADCSLQNVRSWRILNPAVKNWLGQPVAFRFLPGTNSLPFAAKNAWWRKRAGFVDHHVWVTPFKEKEKYAAGDFPNQSTGGDGLSKWTAQDRPIANTDLVFWYTFGLTHLPRVEEYPIMACANIGFGLRPDGFFKENPSLDVPPSGAVGKACKRDTGAFCGIF